MPVPQKLNILVEQAGKPVLEKLNITVGQAGKPVLESCENQFLNPLIK